MRILSRDRVSPNGTTTSTTLDAGVDAQGNFTLSGTDVGPMVEDVWGHDDYEYGLTISPQDMQQLWPFIARHLVTATGPLTFGDIVKLCETAGIDPKFQTWP